MHFVYVLSPDFSSQLYLSLRSLFTSETTVDKVTIFSVGERVKLSSGHLPIEVLEVPTKSREYWMLNKAYVSEVKGENVTFLDTDVIVRGKIDEIVDSEKDVSARRSTAYTLDTYDEEIWKGYLQENNVEVEVPILNTGVLSFQNGAHRGIGEEWERCMYDAWERGFFGNGYHADQWSLPVVLGRRAATYSLLGPGDHALAWEGDPWEGATLYHTGASNFFSSIRAMEKPDFVDADLPIPRPNITWNYVKDRLARRWKTLTSAMPKAEHQDIWRNG